jgi:glutaredoxin
VKVELLVSEWCPTCPQAERVWTEVAAERDIEFAVLDLNQTAGRELAHRLRVRTIPAIAIDGELKAVGVQSLAEARQMVAAAPRRQAARRHAGITLSVDNRWFVSSAMLWLLAGALWLTWQGTLTAEGPLRGIGLHLFTAGFVQTLIYGLGAHMLPRFTGRPIASGTVAWLQFGLHHGGLLMFLGGLAAGLPVLAISGGLLGWTALAVFAARIMPLLWPMQEAVGHVNQQELQQ